MNEGAGEIEVVRFGEFEISKAQRLLLRNGQLVTIQARPFDLLIYLLENRARVVSRDELLLGVWKGVRVNDQALRFALHALRRAIGDSGREQRVIRTVRGTGFQFIAVTTIDRRRATGTHARETDHSFLGREGFLQSLDRAIAEVASGHVRTILLAGEPGIGKTTALSRAAELASERGFRVASVRCSGTNETPALWPWTELIRRLIDHESRHWLASTIASGADALAWVVPELQELVSGRIASPVLDSRYSQHRLFESVKTLIDQIATQEPVGILIDDVHEADQATLTLLEYLTSATTANRLLIIATYRAHGEPYQRCAETVASILRRKGGQLIALSGLAHDHIALLAEAHAQVRPSAEAVQSLFDKCNGNPFFLLQILRVLESDGRLHTIALPRAIEYSIPRGIREAIILQIACLPLHVRRMLNVASVLQKEFTTSVIAHALRVDTRDVLRDLEIASDAGVCVCDDDGSYRFSHGLMREALYASLTATERAANSGLVANALETIAGADVRPLAADIAHLYAAAFPDSESRRAIQFLRQAAEWDVERAAFESALAHLDRAKALLERMAPGDRVVRSELCLDSGFVYGLLGDRERAGRELKHASQIAVDVGRSDLAARAALLFAPDLLALETGVFDADLVRLLEAALAIMPRSAPERPRLLARLAVALHWSDEPRARLHSLVGDAILDASGSCDPSLSSFVEIAGTLALYSVTTPYESLKGSRFIASDETSTSLLKMILRVTALWQIGRLRDVEIEIDSFLSYLKSARTRSANWYGGMLRATMALMKGEYAQANELGEEFLRQGLAVDDRNALHSFALQRAMAAIDVGGLEQIEPAVVNMASSFPRVEGWQTGVAYLFCELGRLAEAQVLLEAAIARGVLDGFPRNSCV